MPQERTLCAMLFAGVTEGIAHRVRSYRKAKRIIGRADGRGRSGRRSLIASRARAYRFW